MDQSISKDSKWNFRIINFVFPALILVIFITTSILIRVFTKKMFLFYDLIYIGFSISLGLLINATLPRKYKFYGRIITQLLVGVYALVFLGIIHRFNMQIEGFFFLFFAGMFVGPATSHFFMAKIFGTVIFNRGWCGWACWTAMILDFLPWKQPKEGRIKNLGVLRYIHFIISLGVTVFLFFIIKTGYQKGSSVSLLWMLIGNIFYYIIALFLAYFLKDNRAFCKYICPISPLQKIFSRFALFKFRINRDKCTECKICEKKCPMNIKLLDYSRQNKRITSTECILCFVCSNSCPKNAVNLSFGVDVSIKENIKYKS